MNARDINPNEARELQNTRDLLEEHPEPDPDAGTAYEDIEVPDPEVYVPASRRFDDSRDTLFDENPGSTSAAPTVTTSSWVAPNRRPRDRKPDRFMPNRLRGQVQFEHPNPPKAVAQAQRDALAKIDEYEAAVQAVLNLGTDQVAESKENQARVDEAVRTGSEVPALTRTDWATEAMVRSARHDIAWKAADAAVKRFQVLAKESIGDWLAGALKELNGSHEKALRAMSKAAPAVAEWRAKMQAAHKLSLATGRFGEGWHQSADPRLARKMGLINGHLNQILEILESEDPVISGEYLTGEYDLEPPLHTRKNLHHARMVGAEWAGVMLGQIEAEEGFSKTQFTPEEERPYYLLPANRMGDKLRKAISEKRLNPVTDM
ncbi:hypothetical protein ACT8ZV_12840 [Nocardioides sp. MAHUQ-72]|uniref:hypothetical protein n=1 Tax=unclassified Nocardioides TaxID=2615069 RepID=UPI0036191A6C